MLKELTVRAEGEDREWDISVERLGWVAAARAWELVVSSEVRERWDKWALGFSGKGLDFIPVLWLFLLFTLHAESLSKSRH